MTTRSKTSPGKIPSPVAQREVVVLGLDPGTRRLGWGVVARRQNVLMARGAGVLKLSEKDDLSERLLQVCVAIREIIATYTPTHVAIEDIFVHEFPLAAIKLGHVRGVLLYLAAEAKLPISEYSPKFIKSAIAGRGAADKSQMARMVAATLSLSKPPPSDAADALAVACVQAKASLFETALLTKRVSSKATPKRGGR